MTQDRSDEALVAAYLDEDARPREREDAFLELVDRFERRVYAICYRHFGNHADAEDATQDTFLAVARKAHQFAGDSKFSTWIYRVAVNACNDLGRKYARRPQTPVADVGEAVADHGGDEATVDDALAGRELAHQIEQALAQLDELSRNLIVLCSIEGMSYAEASEVFDLPVGTIKSRVFRARARLAELLEPDT
ncbi:MAG: sigma-70 family RNA polymerase sigma factor, partial [Nitriliruptorales bacterium]|nr:sigma-70 family RNA polymerase sigma factor [Nitriliruptorales bacterium]